MTFTPYLHFHLLKYVYFIYLFFYVYYNSIVHLSYFSHVHLCPSVAEAFFLGPLVQQLIIIQRTDTI